MYQELVDLNPELKEARISPSQVRSYVAVISGACSGFPPEDIIEFSRAGGADNDRLNEEKRRFPSSSKDAPADAAPTICP